MSDLFIFAGEASADLHGANILLALQTTHPHLPITGVGGPKMRAAGLVPLLTMEAFAVMGFIDVFLVLPRLIRQFYQVARFILQEKPAVVLFIDYPGFNLRMAKYLRKKHFQGKLYQFISPSVWAWGKKRISLMADNLDHLFSILPFEKELFARTKLPVSYVGHPLVERIQAHTYRPLPLPTNRKIVALFPGSRQHELKRNFPCQINACKQLQRLHPDLFFALSLSRETFRNELMSYAKKQNFVPDLIVSEEQGYDLMKLSHLAIAKSGTVTLELALHHVPTIVTYGISSWDLFIARDLLRIRLPFYCIVNILSKKLVFPELFGPHLSPEAIFSHAHALLLDSHLYAKTQQDCKELTALLGPLKSSEEVSKLLFSGIFQERA